MASKTLKQLLWFALGIGLLVWVLYSIDFSKLFQNLAKIAPSYYIAILLFTTLTHYSRALRWRLMLQSTGHKPSIANTVLATMSAYFVNQGLPRVGEVTRCTVLADTHKIPLQTSIGTVIAERIVDVLCMLVFSGSILLFNYGLLQNFVVTYLYTPVAEKLSQQSPVIYIGLGILGILIIGLFFWLYSYYQKHKAGKLRSIVLGLIQGLTSVYNIKKPWQFWGHTAFIWTMYFVMTWYWFDVLPSIAMFSFGQVLFIFAVGNFSRSIPIQAGSLPAYIFLVSKALVLLGATQTDADTLVLIIPGIQTAFYIVAGGFCFVLYLLLRIRLAKPKSA